MDNQDAQQVQGPLPPPARAAMRREVVTHEDVFKAFEFMDNFGVRRKWLPLPKGAPKIEAKEFPFDKNNDDTGSDLGNLFKRGIYQLEDVIGDKRREILHVLPINKRNKGHVKQLRIQLEGLKDKLMNKIDDMQKATGILLTMPYHFKDFPALED